MIFINQISLNYKQISNLSKEQICGWFNKQYGHQYVLNVSNFKFNISNFNIYINIEGILLSPKNLNQSYNQLSKSSNNHQFVSQIKVSNIRAKINILALILFRNIKINNFIANNIIFTANDLYANQSIDTVTGKINIKFKDKANLNLQLIVDIVVEQIPLNINFQINGLDNFKFNLIHKKSDVRRLLKYLPQHFINTKLILWLDKALLSGEVKFTELYLDSEDSFYLNIKFEDVLFNYAKDWPLVQHLSANLKILNNNLEINMIPTSTSLLPSILNQPIKTLNAKLNFAEHKPLLIEAQISNSLASKGVEFLQQTNLLKELGDGLSQLSIQGNMDILFNLLIPLELDDRIIEKPIEYLGEIKLNKASLKILDIPIHKISTNIKFANNYLATDNLTGKLFDIPIIVSLLLDKELLIINNPVFKLKTIVKNSSQSGTLKIKDIYSFVNEIKVFDNLFENIRILNDDNAFSLIFNDHNAKGSIVYNKNSNENQLILNFDKLKIKSQETANNKHDLNSLLYLIKTINFNCNQLYLDNIYLGAINFNIDKNLKPESYFNQLDINSFKFSTNNLNSNFIGDIKFKNLNNFNTAIKGRINSVNFGSGLRELNINTKFIANGNGYINFDLNSATDPFTIDLSKIIGKFDININSGFILGLDPGFGRIIGLFNIENIQRRLLLDFSDVTNQGFSFDKLIGELELHHGELILHKISINGPSANISISGSTSLLTKKLNLLMEVTSKVGATLPIAAAVAGNPVIGAAMWLFDFASGAKFSQLKFAKYKITGVWNQPEIKILKNTD